MGWEAGQRGLKILAVDDSESVRALVRISLAPHGFEVHEAADGAKALAMIHEMPDLVAVVCDLNMPVMNGLVFLENLRRDPRYAALPVVMLSIVGHVNDVKLARGLGVLAWLTKPFEPLRLVATLTKLLVPGGDLGQ